jgi:hypothetical protein
VPDIPLQKYLKRIARYTDCNIETLVCAVMYVLRVSRRSDLMITSLNVHRLLITSVVVSMKYVEDECFTNRYMAKVGGVSLHELNRLEISFLKRLEFNLHIAPDNFEQFCSEICRLDAQIMMEEISARLPAVPTCPSPPQAYMTLAHKVETRRKELARNCSAENMEVVVTRTSTLQPSY